MTAAEMRPFLDGVGNYAKWDTKGWFADQYRYSEGAMCACRDYTFTEEEFAARKDYIGSSADFLELQQRVIPAVGASFQFQAPGSTVAATLRVQLVRPTQASSCLLIQFTQMPQSDPRRNDFFNRLTPIAISRSDIAVGTPAERLRVLESLRAEGLISVDDYNARKKVIVNSL